MDAVDVIAVVGGCAPERARYAQHLADRDRRALVSAQRLGGSPDPVREGAELAVWTSTATGAVVELPLTAAATDLIGEFADAGSHTRLRELICVVDAAHIRADLHRDDYLALRDSASGLASMLAARSHLIVTQIEFASTIVLVNWQAQSPTELAVTMALVSHLSPRARLRLQGAGEEGAGASEDYSPAQDRAGWMCVLNGDFDPHMTDPRVRAVRYEQVRPFHPGRLMRVLDERIERGEFGTLVRSAGFCRLAGRGGTVAQWEHVGRVISLHPVGVDELVGDADELVGDADELVGDGDELLAIGQDLALIGIDLEPAPLTAALDAAALTDAELAGNPRDWASFDDPFPAWPAVADHRD